MTHAAPDPDEQRNRDLLIGMAQRLRRVYDADQIRDAGTAVDLLVSALAAELHRQGFVCRPSETLIGRLRPFRLVGSVVAGVLALGLVLAAVALVVLGWS